MEQLEKLFKDTLSGETLVRMVFSAKRRKSLEYSRVVIRPVKVSGRI